MKYRYSWTKKFPADAQAVGEWLYALPSRTVTDVVEAARSRRSPAHKLFTWDDTEAAAQWRLTQAGVLINSIRVEVVTPEKKIEHVQAFIRSADRTSYVATLEASDEDLSAAEQRFLMHMRAFRARWHGLQIARPVIDAIHEVEQRASRRVKRKRAA